MNKVVKRDAFGIRCSQAVTVVSAGLDGRHWLVAAQGRVEFLEYLVQSCERGLKFIRPYGKRSILLLHAPSDIEDA